MVIVPFITSKVRAMFLLCSIHVFRVTRSFPKPISRDLLSMVSLSRMIRTDQSVEVCPAVCRSRNVGRVVVFRDPGSPSEHGNGT